MTRAESVFGFLNDHIAARERIVITGDFYPDPSKKTISFCIVPPLSIFFFAILNNFLNEM